MNESDRKFFLKKFFSFTNSNSSSYSDDVVSYAEPDCENTNQQQKDKEKTKNNLKKDSLKTSNTIEISDHFTDNFFLNTSFNDNNSKKSDFGDSFNSEMLNNSDSSTAFLLKTVSNKNSYPRILVQKYDDLSVKKITSYYTGTESTNKSVLMPHQLQISVDCSRAAPQSGSLASFSSTTPLIQLDSSFNETSYLLQKKLNQTHNKRKNSKELSTKSLLEKQHSIELRPFRKKEVLIVDQTTVNQEKSNAPVLIANNPTSISSNLNNKTVENDINNQNNNDNYVPFILENSPRYSTNMTKLKSENNLNNLTDANFINSLNNIGQGVKNSFLYNSANNIMRLSLSSKFLPLKHRYIL
jgi:hypothetical protein